MTEAEIIARIAELEAENAAASGWGAAVGARAEEIRELRGELNRLRPRRLTDADIERRALFCALDHWPAADRSPLAAMKECVEAYEAERWRLDSEAREARLARQRELALDDSARSHLPPKE